MTIYQLSTPASLVSRDLFNRISKAIFVFDFFFLLRMVIFFFFRRLFFCSPFSFAALGRPRVLARFPASTPSKYINISTAFFFFLSLASTFESRELDSAENSFPPFSVVFFFPKIVFPFLSAANASGGHCRIARLNAFS